MDIRTQAGSLDSLLSPQHKKTQGQAEPPFLKQAIKTRASQSRDLINVPNQNEKKPAFTLQQNEQQKTRSGHSNGLVSEDTIDVENGYRTTQKFERENGQGFTRIEEVTNTANRSKRTVIQQNASGSTTALERILDRQDNGLFRLTQRYTNEIGEISTNIEYDVNPNDADIMLGKAPSPERRVPPPFQSSRGTQFDAVV